MSRPTATVRVFFGTTPSASTLFTLDDSTRGLLDSATYTLGGDTGTDVSADVNHIGTSRGRPSLVFDQIDAGTCRIQLNNDRSANLGARTYDPFNASGPYYGLLKPGIRVEVEADGYRIFTGKVSDWNLTFDTSGRSIAEMVCEDALATLARKQFDAWTATSGQTAGARLTDVLNRSEIGWPGGARDLDTGISTLQGDSITWGSNCLNYCQLVAKSDGPASFFASRDGLITFRDRHATLTAPISAVFANDGTNIPFQQVEVQVGSETYYTRVSVDREGGTAQTYTTTAATTEEIRSLSIGGLLLDSDAQALEMATYYANVYATGDARVSGLTVVAHRQASTGGYGLAVDRLVNLLQLELNDVVTVTFTPNNTGSAINQTCVVSGISHTVTPDLHTVQLKLDRFDNHAPFILDDASLGLLDGTSVLAF